MKEDSESGTCTSLSGERWPKTFYCMLDDLAFLPIGNDVSGIQYLREKTPDGFEPRIDYFDKIFLVNKHE